MSLRMVTPVEGFNLFVLGHAWSKRLVLKVFIIVLYSFSADSAKPVPLAVDSLDSR